ncbi:MarR family transcriptional regulator [Streptomyces atroolivaceus]|uniref:MarR family transcriptional regulator n=1 Tax=Streptomyces atroolivaceus TaxID=66869 RepID=UPI00379FDEE0
MATENLSPALPAPAASRPYAKAHPGYGKRTTPGQRPPRADDFALLPERERYVAGYVDRLPEGGAMDVKSLAKSLPLYGQMAVGSALRALGVAGHLRRVRCQVVGEGGQSRWVTRTFWSRTAHNSEWWDIFTRTGTGDHRAASVARPDETASAEPPQPSPASPPPLVPAQRAAPTESPAGHSPAYLALARLGRTDPRLTLSAADCTVLEGLAAAWLDRGVNTDYLVQALTAGLPAQVGSPVGFVRRRLTDKIPPRLPVVHSTAAQEARVHRVMMECTECGVPGPPEALPDGLCRPCRTSSAPNVDAAASSATAEAPADRDIHATVANLRNLMRTP